MPAGVEEGIRKGMYLLSEGPANDAPRVQLLGSGTILREVVAGAELLQNDFGIAADVWSVTSFNELRRDGLSAERWSRLNPGEERRKSYVERNLEGRGGPVIASTDYMRSFPDQIRAFVPQRYVTLGTDGFGRSDTREQLRSFFEIDRYHVALAALQALADEGKVPREKVVEGAREIPHPPR